MSSQKNRDLAQELVDFLMKEDQQKTAAKKVPPVPGEAEKKSKPKPAMATPHVPPPPPMAPAMPVIPPVPKAKGAQAIIVETDETPMPSEKIKPPQVPKPSAGMKMPPPPGVAEARVENKNEPETYILDESVGDYGLAIGEKNANATQAKTEPAVLKAPEMTGFLGEKAEPDPVSEPVNFIAPSEKAQEILNAEPSTAAKAPTFDDTSSRPVNLQGFATNRSKQVQDEVSSLMAGTEAVKVAQARISVLEKERDKLRDETEQLLTASESFQRRLQELKAQYETLERKHREKIEILEDEKAVFKSRLDAREDELEHVKRENEDLKLRFQSDLRKIRVRERELEARQEIVKAEHAAVLRVKDEAIMELKRQVEKMQFEADNFRSQMSELNSRISESHERNHRTVKALRLALSILETGDGEDKMKKAVG